MDNGKENCLKKAVLFLNKTDRIKIEKCFNLINKKRLGGNI